MRRGSFLSRPASLKRLVFRQGHLPSETLRLPMTPVSPELQAKLEPHV
ncbi:hypothetical protein BN871_KO_00040 [Paenibacillus sp. P22]|nr:hypothetical protein BN871_KO_00040 [Paenibacillus sp. P22]